MDHSPNPIADSLPRTGRAPLGDRDVSCADHGPYRATGVRYQLGRIDREVWTPCPGCEDARIAAERQADAQKRAEAMRKRLEGMMDDAAIPARFIGRTLDNFIASTPEQVRALEIAREFAQNFAEHNKRGTGLILAGLPGTGKSHMATAILQAIMPAHHGFYATCMGLIRAVRGTWRKDSERSEAEVLGILSGADLLVLDEIGVQYGTDGEQTILFDVLDRRYRDMRPTILLTNQNKQGFKEFIGERSFDRLVETSRWVSFDWGSYRTQARKEAV